MPLDVVGPVLRERRTREKRESGRGRPACLPREGARCPRAPRSRRHARRTGRAECRPARQTQDRAPRRKSARSRYRALSAAARFPACVSLGAPRPPADARPTPRPPEPRPPLPPWVLLPFACIRQKHRDSVPTDEVVPESGDGRPPRKPPRAQDGSTYLHVPEAPGPVDDEEFLHQVSVRGGEGAETALASRSRPQGTETVTGRTARPPGRPPGAHAAERALVSSSGSAGRPAYYAPALALLSAYTQSRRTGIIRHRRFI